MKDLRAGLPNVETLRSYRIWDTYFTPAFSHPGAEGTRRLFADTERAMPAIRKGAFEKLCYFPHVGTGTTADPGLETLLANNEAVVRSPLTRWPGMLLGMIQLNSGNPARSRDAIRRWIRDGPMVGVYFPGGGPGAVNCSHPNCAKLVEEVMAARGLILQHTWFITGGNTGAGMSTPTDLAALARRYPQQSFICAHAGGEWEKGLRAIRDVPNVLIETSGFDATAGFLEMAVREIGDQRIVFGSHLPSRSLGTELSKVVYADLPEASKAGILGANFRGLLRSVGRLPA